MSLVAAGVLRRPPLTVVQPMGVHRGVGGHAGEEKQGRVPMERVLGGGRMTDGIDGIAGGGRASPHFPYGLPRLRCEKPNH